MLSLQIFSPTPSVYDDAASIARQHDLTLYETVDSVPRLVERIFRDTPNMLLLELPKNTCEQIELLYGVLRVPLETPPKLFVLTDAPPDFRLPDEVLFCFCKPSAPKDIFQRIALLSDAPVQTVPSSRLWDRICSDLLLRLGVSPRLQGFEMLRKGAAFLLERPIRTDVRIMYDLYPSVAQATGTSVCVVEHAMRHAIETAWMRADLEELDAFTGYTTRETKPTPSNSAFLFMLTERVQMRLNGGGHTETISREMQRYES